MQHNRELRQGSAPLPRPPRASPGCIGSLHLEGEHSIGGLVNHLSLAIALGVALGRAAAGQQYAHATEQLGTVHFATSCKPAVAPTFDRAVALLHSFEFGASIRAFGDVLGADSSCAMAYWGI